MPQTNPPIEDVAAAIELLPCPFCGSKVELVEHDNLLCFKCPDSSPCIGGWLSSYGHGDHRDEAIACWNTRSNQIACPSGGEVRHGTIALELSCNTQLRCAECGSQDFRLGMEADEDTNEISTSVANNVECSKCHALYQIKYFPALPPPDPAVGATARELLDSLRPERFDTMLDVEIEALHERVSAWITAALARAGGSEVRRDTLEEAARYVEVHPIWPNITLAAEIRDLSGQDRGK